MVAEAPWRNRIVGAGAEAPDQLLANPKNWRTHPAEQRNALRGSLDTVGWVQQVLVNRRTGNIVDGHARVEEALSRNEPTVPVLYVELEPDEEALVLATLDPIGAMANTDNAKLAELLGDLSVDDDGLAALLRDLAPPKRGLTDPDTIPPLGDDSNIHLGDVFVLGEHRLMCGDATSEKDVTRLMAGEQATLMWTDPPYGVAYEGKTPQRLTLDNDTPAESSHVIEGAFRIAPLQPSARFYIAAPSGPQHVAFHEAVQAVGWRLHQELVWVKGSIVLGHSDYHYAHEPILYGYVPGPGRPGRGAHEGTRWYGGHAQSSVMEYPKPAASRDHPTAKPTGLIEQCLANSSLAGDLLYEPFNGGGSTLIAAEQLNRRCYAMEIDPRYVAVAIKRWEDFTGQKSERVNA